MSACRMGSEAGCQGQRYVRCRHEDVYAMQTKDPPFAPPSAAYMMLCTAIPNQKLLLLSLWHMTNSCGGVLDWGAGDMSAG